MSNTVTSKTLLKNPTEAVQWVLNKISSNAPKAGTFAIRNHAFSAASPKAGAFAIRNHAFSA